jgi:hypothetical protein
MLQIELERSSGCSAWLFPATVNNRGLINLFLSARKSSGPNVAMLRFDATKRPVRNYFSRWEQWRLLLLVLSLGVVILVMREVRQPENVDRVTQAFAADATRPVADKQSGSAVPAPQKTPLNSFRSVAPGNANLPAAGTAMTASAGPKLDELLSLAGWTAERFAKFADDRPLTDVEREELVQLVWRVRTFDAASIENWAKNAATPQQIADSPEAHRGDMVHFTARVVKIERHELAAKEAAQYEMPTYHLCELRIDGGDKLAIVATPTVPRQWDQLHGLDEPVSVSGLFVKQLPAGIYEASHDEPVNLFVAKRIAWHPTRPQEPAVSFGASVLGTLGMDVGLLDEVRSHGRFDTPDAAERGRFNDQREAFYQILDVVGRIGANQLIRFADGNLEAIRRHWQHEFSIAKDDKLRALAHQVIQSAEKGRYSVMPLFFDAKRQIGQLIVLDGVARRVVRIDVGSEPAGSGASDVARRFGIDHYYEMEVFTDDSQNYPLVFCVRELPNGLGPGEELRVPVRVAGFFFKNWRYTGRAARNSASTDRPAGNEQRRYAPLLIGRAPLLLRVEETSNATAQMVGGGLFLLALGGIWAAAWWLARSDRKFAEQRRMAGNSLPSGQSLNSLNLAPVDKPMNYPGGANQATGDTD